MCSRLSGKLTSNTVIPRSRLHVHVKGRLVNRSRLADSHSDCPFGCSRSIVGQTVTSGLPVARAERVRLTSGEAERSYALRPRSTRIACSRGSERVVSHSGSTWSHAACQSRLLALMVNFHDLKGEPLLELPHGKARIWRRTCTPARLHDGKRSAR